MSYSDAPDALQGGNMGWREQDRLPEIFSEALGKLKPGEVSDVVRSPAGFHLLKLNERRGRGGGAFVVEQTHVRHILARVGELVSEAEARRKLALLRTRIVQGANFAELARLNSDDTASATRGGDLGWVVPGDLVPEFERAAAALKPGEISEPVRTAFGLHLIEVIGAAHGRPLVRPQTARGAQGAARAQERRVVRGVAAPAPRPRLRRVPARGAVTGGSRARRDARTSRASASDSTSFTTRARSRRSSRRWTAPRDAWWRSARDSAR